VRLRMWPQPKAVCVGSGLHPIDVALHPGLLNEDARRRKIDQSHERKCISPDAPGESAE
jgi:hypothetical protein